MKYPERSPETTRAGCKPASNFYDHEHVVQDDGRIAYFSWCNDEKEKGWVFQNFKDSAGFHLFEPGSKEEAAAQRLARSRIEDSPSWFNLFVGRKEAVFESIKPDEQLNYYKCGGVLSSRAGVYVSPKGNPGLVLRYQGLWLS